MRTKYYAVSITKLLELMETAGFVEVTRVDERFFRPVILGKKSLNLQIPAQNDWKKLF
jgi:hypothetical protein